MLILKDITYIHPNGEILCSHLNLSLNPYDKIALIGANGAGKSTLLKIIAGLLPPTSGSITTEKQPYYVPQVFGQFDNWSIAKALNVEAKLQALTAILSGTLTEAYYETIGNDWQIEERCQAALLRWGLADIELDQLMGLLSGGQQTKVFLAGLYLHSPEIVLLDEPTNHLDVDGRKMLYNYVQQTKATMMIVSHDRSLLGLLPLTAELEKDAINLYGGSYDFYFQQKKLAQEALVAQAQSLEKEVRKAKEIQRKATERQQKLDSRGKKKQLQAGLPTIAMKTFKNRAERSTAKLRDVHDEKIDSLSQKLSSLRTKVQHTTGMKMGLDDMGIHKGKVIISGKLLNYSYGKIPLWSPSISLELRSGERVALSGSNGSGKSTLVKLLLGELVTTQGTVYRAEINCIYVDQHYSLLNPALSVYQQAQTFNNGALQEHEIKVRLDYFLFEKQDWEKKCTNLSGGERMRLCLCCLSIAKQAPDLIVLDEPTNNLDLQHIQLLTSAINDYHGTLLVISHDVHFLQEIGIERKIMLD